MVTNLLAVILSSFGFFSITSGMLTLNETYWRIMNPESQASSLVRILSGTEDNVTFLSQNQNTTEIQSLLFMVEEEKLARDVYLQMYDKWGLAVFKTISGSEQTHMDSVRNLILAYGLDDPTNGMDIGEFSNPDLQNLYNEFITTGNRSMVSAIQVGAAIEEIDIRDLEGWMETVDDPEIGLVFSRLEHGSKNHLRAFATNFERFNGFEYQPQYISDTLYQSIISQTKGNRNQFRGRWHQ